MSSFVVTTLSENNESYSRFLEVVKDNFTAEANNVARIYQTNAEGLWDAFLANIPDIWRQHYSCHACRRFVNTYGGLVKLSHKGKATSVVWNLKETPDFFKPAVAAVLEKVDAAEVSGIFLSEDKKWGTPTTGNWHHLHIIPDKRLVYKPTRLKTTEQAIAERLEEFKMVKRGLEDFSQEIAAKAYSLASTGQLYRGEKIVDNAKWLLELIQSIGSATGSKKDNLIWLAVDTAPAGFCRIRSSMLGTLLKDLAEGLPLDTVKKNFQNKMDPSSYMRSQAAPSSGNIAQAERIIAKLAAEGSLPRRYATLADIAEKVWVSSDYKKADKSVKEGLFSHIEPKKKKSSQTVALGTNATVMTWDKFSRTVLPEAQSVEVKVPNDSRRFASLVTAANMEAPPIVQWDSESSRNPVTWYYQGGADAEIQRRVKQAGGKYDDVSIRASLIWNNRNDLDLHATTPLGDEIYFARKVGKCRGYLDVDMNVHGETNTPVENIRWAKGQAPEGRYTFFVQNYRFHEYNRRPTLFTVELEVDGEIRVFEGVASPHGQTHYESNITVFTVDYRRNGSSVITGGTAVSSSSSSNSEVWGLSSGTWAKVSAITLSPNMWGDKPQAHHGKHVFFLLDGCEDVDKTKARGFFTEMLKSEFREVRVTLDAHVGTMTIETPKEPVMAGLGFKESPEPWTDALLKVTNKHGVEVVYKLDRWD